VSGAHRPDFEQVAAWLRANPSATRQEAATKFGWSFATVSANWQALKKPVKTKGAPARTMSESDRDAVLETVRDSYAILRMLTRQMRLDIEEAINAKRTPALSRDTIGAMNDLQRMASGMIDAHPGLLELAKSASPDGGIGEDELLGIVDALEH
jgi:hypothetical protein